jgi:mannosyltransferase
VAGLFVLTLGIAGFRIGKQSIWLDEAISISYAMGPSADVPRDVMTDANGILYYALLSGWVHLVGDTEGLVRALSAIFAALTPPVVFLIGRRLFVQGAGLLAAVFLATQGFFIEYAQQARSYALATLLATVATYLLLRAVAERCRRWWGLYAVVLAAGVYAHLLVAFIAVAHVLWLVAYRADIRHGLAAVALAVALSLPMLAYVILDPAPTWMPRLSLEGVGNVVLAFGSGSWLAVGAEGVAVGIALLAWRRANRGLALALLWLAVPILALLILSAVQPFLVARYALIALPGLALVVGAAVSMLPRRPLRAVAIVVIFALSLGGLASWYATPSVADWRSAVRYLVAEAAPGDAITFYPAYVDVPARYYLRRQGATLPIADPAVSDAVLDRAADIWLVMNYDAAKPRPGELNAIVRGLEVHHKAWGKILRFGRVQVWHFIPRPGP